MSKRAKYVLLGLFNFVFRTTLFICLTLLALNLLLDNSQNLKKIINENNAYQRFNQVLVDSLKNSPQEANSIPFDDPRITQIIKNNFDPQTMQTVSEGFLDSFYDWLNGKTPGVTYQADLTKNKQKLALQIAEYGVEKVSNLEYCPRPPTETNIFKLECRPYGLGLADVKNQLYDSIANNKDFLSNGKLSIDSLPKVDGKKTIVEAYPNAPTYFSYFKILPYVLLSLSALFGIFVVYIYRSKLNGLSSVGFSLASTGLFLAVTPIIYIYVLPRIGFKMPEFNGGGDNFSEIINDVINLFYADLNVTMINIAIQVLAAGVIIIFIARFFKRNQSIYNDLEKKTGLSSSEKKKSKVKVSTGNVPVQSSEAKKTKTKKSTKSKKYRKI